MALCRAGPLVRCSHPPRRFGAILGFLLLAFQLGTEFENQESCQPVLKRSGNFEVWLEGGTAVAQETEHNDKD